MIDQSASNATKIMKKSVQELRAGNFDSAVTLTDEILEQDPNHAGANALQFSALFKSQRFEQARRMGTKAAELNPRSVFILNNQACLQLEAKQPAAAAGLLKSLIDQFGERGQWLYNLALAQKMVGNIDYALTTFARTLDFDHEHDRAAFQLADCLKISGNPEQAVRAYDFLRLLRHKHAPSHCNYLHHAVINNSITSLDLELEMALWRDRFIPTDRCYDTHKVENENQLRIGFSIGRLPSIWVQSLIAPVINTLAAGRDSVHVYWHDDLFDQNLFADSVNIEPSAQLTDADFARKVRADQIDTLVDICGMRIGARQRALGLQVAGQQYGWLGHEGRYATPLVKILEPLMGSHCYAANLNEVEYTDPLPENTFTTTGTHHGISNETVRAWSNILHALPTWKIHIDATNKLVSKRIRELFLEQGIEQDRLLFLSNPTLENGAIALDNITENDPVSVINALHQGAIIVAKTGDLFPAQHTSKILIQCGRKKWLCKSTYHYQTQAIDLATSAGRKGLTENEFERSKLNDIAQFSQHLRSVISP